MLKNRISFTVKISKLSIKQLLSNKIVSNRQK